MDGKTMISRTKSLVMRVEKRKRKQYVSGYGENAVFIDMSDGWFVVLEGHVSLSVGDKKPDVKPGDWVVNLVYKEI